MAHPNTVRTSTDATSGPLSRKVHDIVVRMIGTLLICAVFGFGTWLAIQRTALPGYTANSVEVMSEDETFDADAIADALRDVRWGREVDLFIYIGPEADRRNDKEEFLDRGISRIRPVAPQYFSSREVLRVGVVGIWINPDSGETIVSKGPDTLQSVDSQYAESLIQEPLILGTLSTNDIVHAVQELAISDGIFLLRDVPAQAVAAGKTIAIAVAPIAWILMRAFIQYRHSRTLCPQLAGTSRLERRKLIQALKHEFTQMSMQIDELTLEIIACSLPTYQSQLDNRFTTWRDSYTNLSELWFEAYGHPESWLAGTPQMSMLWKIKQQTDAVRGALNVLFEDIAALKTPTKFRPWRSSSAQTLKKAIEQAQNLRAEMSVPTEELTDQIDRWLYTLQSAPSSVKSVEEVEHILRVWDALAIDISQQLDQQLTLVEAQRAMPFAGQSDFEKPAAFRSISAAENIDDIIQLGDSNAGTPVTPEVARVKGEKRRRPSVMPYSSRFIAGALTVALLVGAGVSVRGFIVGEQKMGFKPFYPAPIDLADNEMEARTLLSEYGGEDSETLVHPTDVIIEDEAGVIKHPDALKKHVEKLGYAIPLTVKILTSDQKSFAIHDNGSLTQASLADIFPDHFEQKPCQAVTSDCSDSDEHWKYGANAVEPTGENVLVVWITDGADCAIDTCGIARDFERTDNQEHLRYSLHTEEMLLNTDITLDIAIWNALVAVSYETRGMELAPDRPEPVASSTYVANGISWALKVALILFLIGLPYSIIRNHRRNRRNKTSEVTSTLTGLSLTIDSRELDVLRAQMEHPDYREILDNRWTRWKKNFEEVVELCGFGNGQPQGDLNEQLLAVRFLRVQAQSLRRTLHILDSRAGRVTQWDDDVSALYATEFSTLDYADSAAIRTITRMFLAGGKTPVESLLALDHIAARYRGAAQVRCLDFVGLEDDTLSEFLRSDVDIHLLATSEVKNDRVLDSRYQLSALVQRAPVMFTVCAILLALFLTNQVVHILRDLKSHTVPLQQTESVLDNPQYGVHELLIEDLGDHFDEGEVETAIRSGNYAFPTNVLITSAKPDPDGFYAPYINGYDYLDFIQGALVDGNSENLPVTPRSLVIRVGQRISVNANENATINPRVLAKLEDIRVSGDITNQLVDALTTDEPVLTLRISGYERR